MMPDDTVGCITDAEEITLNYVSPDARLRGDSSALLKALEHRAMERGNETCRLTSTETARRFYLARIFRRRTHGRQVWHEVQLPDVKAADDG
jgi:GNAT superfamily N-acetyltransferase